MKVIEDESHFFRTDDFVQFVQIKGMTEINNLAPAKGND
jgi:hypothetical protein